MWRADLDKRCPCAAAPERLVGMDRIHARQTNGQDWVRVIYTAVCARERLAIVVATETKVQICSGTTRRSCSDEKQKEQKGRSNTMIQLDSAQFPSDSQKVPVCARERARLRVFERESESAERQTSGEQKTRANKMSR